MTRTAAQFCALFLLALVAGCAQWKEQPPMESILTSPTQSPSTSVIEIAFIPLPVDEGIVDWELWNAADEQVLSSDLRKQLAANGLRAGRMTGDLPEYVREVLGRESTDQALNMLQQANLLSDIAQGARQIHCRLDTRYELPVRDEMRGLISTLIRDGDILSGRTLFNPLFQFSFTMRRSDSGDALLRLVPEIQHGQVRQTWVSNEQAMRLDSRRDREVLDHLALEIPINEGHVVLITPTTDAHGLGEKMFVGTRVDGQPEVVALVLRMTASPTTAF